MTRIDEIKAEIANFERSELGKGVCCCGDDMDNHPNPMYCGHSPVDSHDDHLYLLKETLQEEIAKSKDLPSQEAVL